MELKVTTFYLENEDKREELLNQLTELLDNCYMNFNMLSLNRYLQRPVTCVDFTEITPKNWYETEYLCINENGLYPFGMSLEEFLSFLKSYATDNYSFHLGNSEIDGSDYNYIAFLEYLAFNNKLDNLVKDYQEFFDTDSSFLNTFVVSKLGMSCGDSLPLQSFISVMLGLQAMTYIKKNIKLLESGKNELYDIEPFKH